MGKVNEVDPPSRVNVNPNFVKAGTPYARSVQQSHPLPRNQLPDPGLVFDTYEYLCMHVAFPNFSFQPTEATRSKYTPLFEGPMLIRLSIVG